MVSILLTLDVSKLSGWLNADAYCRESEEELAMRGEVRGPGGGKGARRRRRTRHARGGPD